MKLSQESVFRPLIAFGSFFVLPFSVSLLVYAFLTGNDNFATASVFISLCFMLLSFAGYLFHTVNDPDLLSKTHSDPDTE
jgi:hypothetical protein